MFFRFVTSVTVSTTVINWKNFLLHGHVVYQEHKKKGKLEHNYTKVLIKQDKHFYRGYEEDFRHLQAFFVVVLQFDLPH